MFTVSEETVIDLIAGWKGMDKFNFELYRLSEWKLPNVYNIILYNVYEIIGLPKRNADNEEFFQFLDMGAYQLEDPKDIYEFLVKEAVNYISVTK